MFLWDFFLAVFIAVIITSLLVGSGRRYGPGEGILTIFLILFLVSWAGGLWITPFGPVLYGIYWMPYLFIGLLFALLLASTIPTRRPHTMKEANEQAREADAAATAALSIFFWIFVVFLVWAIIAAYIY